MGNTSESAKRGVATTKSRYPNHFVEAGRKGGSRKVKKGLALLSKARRREIASMGGKASQEAKS